MVKFIYTIYDKKTEVYSPPFYQFTDAAASREVKQAMKDSQLGQFSEDYALYVIGQWRDDTGSITSSDKPQLVAEISALKDQE